MLELNAQNALVWIAAGSAFLLVISLWLGVMVLMGLRSLMAAQKIENRLALDEQGRHEAPRTLQLWHDGKIVTMTVANVPLHTGLVARMEEARRILGWNVSLPGLALGYVGLILTGFLLGLVVSASGVVASGGAGLAAIIPYLLVKHQINNRNALFERQFSDALSLATRSLRAGQPLMGSFRLIAEEMDPPVSELFDEICQQQALGVSVDDAVRNIARKTANSDMKLFAASMHIQLRSGGNLADMMERLAAVIRDRIRLHRRAKVLTAQTQLSKRVLIAVPVLIFFILYVINRDYLAPLYETDLGRVLLVIGALLLIVGTWVMNRMSILHY